MKSIGGYFGLEVPRGRLPYPDAAPVNFGRGGLELIVRTRAYRRIWIPDYICPVVPIFLDRMGIEYLTYEINDRLEPVSIPVLEDDEAFLYVNYFGVKDVFCRELEKGQKNLVLDLTQSFYYEPVIADGFNSARKFFGVPDGGFVFGRGLSADGLPESVSYDRCESLLRRADGDLAGGYEAFHRLDDELMNAKVERMSLLTRALLSSCDIGGAANKRRANYRALSEELQRCNQVDDALSSASVPLIYPYLITRGSELRKYLISRGIYCPTYWPNGIGFGRMANRFAEDMVCIPIDQRYGGDEMDFIKRTIGEFV